MTPSGLLCEIQVHPFVAVQSNTLISKNVDSTLNVQINTAGQRR